MLYITWILKRKKKERERRARGEGGWAWEERERGEQVSIISALWGPTCTRTY
jgi:hypothetical protein